MHVRSLLSRPTSSCLLLLGLTMSSLVAEEKITFEQPVNVTPRHYVCYQTDEPLRIDGKLDERAWQQAPWTEYFVDIRGVQHPHQPTYKTRAKLLWDKKYLYIAAEIEDPHVWATLTERESIIFYDNDFEVFIDPDGDTHHYMEYEINALGTEWDLMLTKPYRDRGNKVLDCWNINGVRSAIHVKGTLNKGDDRDEGWTVEIAMPLDSLCEADKKMPAQGQQWRINFSRVQWASRWEKDGYKKIPHPITKKEGSGAEDNWVWSPQGVVNMHRPETWGYLQFSEKMVGKGFDAFQPDRAASTQWALRQLYYRMWEYHAKHKKHAASLAEIRADEVRASHFTPLLHHVLDEWCITSPDAEGRTQVIYSDGRSITLEK